MSAALVSQESSDSNSEVSGETEDADIGSSSGGLLGGSLSTFLGFSDFNARGSEQ